MDTLNVFEKGCLGTCWYGKYHYMEPWVGCEHNCAYCYAKHRSNVLNTLEEQGTTFTSPKLLIDLKDLKKKVAAEVAAQNISIVKLSRFTDIFTPTMIDNGASFAVLEALLESEVKRIILTTKSIPNKEITELFIRNKDKISFNVALKPKPFLIPENTRHSIDEMLAVSEKIQKAGILTTVHMDPLLPNFDDDEESLNAFFAKLTKHNLKRVMFSYLLLNHAMLDLLKEKLDVTTYATIEQMFEVTPKQMLPKQEETVYFNLKDPIRIASVNRIARLLKEHSKEFVLCGLKNGKGELPKSDDCPMCDGKFYA